MSSFIAFDVVFHNIDLPNKKFVLFFKEILYPSQWIRKKNRTQSFLTKRFRTPAILTRPSTRH